MSAKIIEELLAHQIIATVDAELLQLKFTENPTNPLRALFEFWYNKTTGRPYQRGWFTYIVDEVKKEEVNIGQFNTFLEILSSATLLESATYGKLKPEIVNCQIANIFHLIYRAGNLNHFYQNFTKENQLAFAKKLTGSGFRDNLLEHRKQKKLMTAIENGSLQSYLDFFKYCYGCRVVKYDPEKSNRDKILKKIVAVLNDMLFDSFIIENYGYEIIKADKAKAPHSGQIIHLTITIGNKLYQSKYELREDLRKEKYNQQYDIENFLKLVNDILADFNIPYCFVLIIDTSGVADAMQEDNQFVIFRIDEPANKIFDMWNHRELFLLTKPHFYPNIFSFPLSYPRIQYALYHYKTAGIFIYLSEEEYAKLTGLLWTNTYKTFADLLNYFPGKVAVIERFTHSSEKPYFNFLQALNTISNHVLNFYDIDDGHPVNLTYGNEEEFVVNFKIDNETHTLNLTATGDFHHHITYYVITEIIRKNYNDYDLHELISGDVKHSYFLFTTVTQAQYLKKYKVLETIGRF